MATLGDAPKAALDALERMERGDPLSSVIPKALEVAKLQGHITKHAWLRLQLIDLDEDKPWNPTPEHEAVWREIEDECAHYIPRNLRWAVYSEYVKSRQTQPASEPSCVSVATMEVGSQPFRGLLLKGPGFSSIKPMLRNAEEVYEWVRERVRSYLKRSAF